MFASSYWTWLVVEISDFERELVAVPTKGALSALKHAGMLHVSTISQVYIY